MVCDRLYTVLTKKSIVNTLAWGLLMLVQKPMTRQAAKTNTSDSENKGLNSTSRCEVKHLSLWSMCKIIITCKAFHEWQKIGAMNYRILYIWQD